MVGSQPRPSGTACLALRLAVLLLVVAGPGGGVAGPSDIGRIDSEQSVPVLVWDNALLDRLSGAERAAHAATESGASSSSAAAQQAELLPQLSLLYPGDSFAARLEEITSPRLAIMLRFAERGRRQLEDGAYDKALLNFEKALALYPERYAPYIYFYLARVHESLGHSQVAYDFLAAAAVWLDEEPEWASMIDRDLRRFP